MNAPDNSFADSAQAIPPQSYRLPWWAIAIPLLGLAASFIGAPATGIGTAIVAIILGASVLAAVYHAEVIAHRVGEPYGTLILALAVTIIEGALIVSMMLSDAEAARTLARDTVFAAIMIVLNGIIGVCLLVGGHRHSEQRYTQYGVSAGLAMLATLAGLTLVLPNFTTSEPGPVYSYKQLIFVGIVSLIIYATYVVAQTMRHRDYFLPKQSADLPPEEPVDHGPQPQGIQLATVFGLLIVALVAVVLLAKALSPAIKEAVYNAGAPAATVGIIIAALVLAPEGLAAAKAARQNKLQTSLNLAMGSALATIGLTIPLVAVVSLMLGLDLELGLSAKSMTLLALTLFVSSLSLSTGKTTVIQGTVHLVIFAAFLFTTLVP